MKICILGSGSSGNSLFLGTQRTKILIDAGFSRRETIKRLESIGEDISEIQAICLTHEHSDHISGLKVLHSQFKMQLYANISTIQSLEQKPQFNSLPWNIFTTGSEFSIGDIQLSPFRVPHDSADPVGFIAESGETKVGIATDLGTSTHLIREKLKKCNILILESNYDPALLSGSRRPWHLKQRIAGRQGHLSNKASAELISAVISNKLETLYLVHLSSDCNRPKLAYASAQRVLKANKSSAKIFLTFRNKTSEIWTSKRYKKFISNSEMLSEHNRLTTPVEHSLYSA
jgi:phosphoribosyl 1,2-cyclic phosphodiesterase